MLLGAAGVAAAGAAAMTWAVRGRSSTVFAPSVWRGDPSRRSVALTFDDGPSESTPGLLDLLAREGVPAAFFQCGANTERLPAVAREVAAAGHEIGNHTYSHPLLAMRTPEFIAAEVRRGQEAIASVTGVTPRWFRAPFGVRWFGLRAAQAQCGLQGVLWTVLARDWKLDAPAIADRVLRLARNGAIICLHDGRELRARPDISATRDGTITLIRGLRERGYRFERLNDILCPQNSSNAS